jgi:hypothetical protein
VTKGKGHHARIGAYAFAALAHAEAIIRAIEADI